MTGDELKAICVREGITPRVVKRNKRQYLYVARWVPGGKNKSGGKMRDRYVCPLFNVEELTEERLMECIQTLPANSNKAEAKAYQWFQEWTPEKDG